MMSAYALADSKRPEIQADAQEALALDPTNPIAAVWAYTKRKIIYIPDEAQANSFSRLITGSARTEDVVEVLIRPIDISLMARAGETVREDCDGFSMYAASLLLALGIPCTFCTVAADPFNSDVYSHVYVIAFPEGQESLRTAVDASHGAYAGWECPNRFGKRRDWPLLNPTDTKLGLIVFAVGAFAAYTIWRNK